MSRKAKVFWGPWAAAMVLACCMILVGAFTSAEAQQQTLKAAAKIETAAKVAASQVSGDAKIAQAKIVAAQVVAAQELSDPTVPVVIVQAKNIDDVTGLTSILRAALKDSRWQLAVAAALALLVLGLRFGAAKLLMLLPRWIAGGLLARFLSWCGTDRGGALLVLASGVATGITNALGAGQPLSVVLVFDAITAAAAAATGSAGLYVLVKKLASPSDKPALTPTV